MVQVEIADWSQSRRLCPSLGSCAARSGHVLWAIEMESDLEGETKREREKGREGKGERRREMERDGERNTEREGDSHTYLFIIHL